MAIYLNYSSLYPVFLVKVAFQKFWSYYPLNPLMTFYAVYKHRAAILEGFSFINVQSNRQVSVKYYANKNVLSLT